MQHNKKKTKKKQKKQKYYDKDKTYIQTKVNGIKLLIYGNVNNQLI